MKNNWDVIIVGAGPGGLFTAWELAKAGKTVLVFDRKRELGVPIRCAEATGEEDLRNFVEVDERWVGQRTNAFIIVLPNGKEIEMQGDIYSGFILNRDLFEYDMGIKVSDEGGSILMKSNVIDVIKDENGRAKGVRVDEKGEIKEYFCKVLVAADGVESRIARKMGVNTALKPQDIEPCVQVTASNVNLGNPKALYMYISEKYAPGGYAWVFPKSNNCANIGLGFNGKFADGKKYAKDYLDTFMKDVFPHASIQKYSVGGVPVTKVLKTIFKENMLIVGDSARMVNPVNGGGIMHAIEAGVFAAKAAANACDDPGKMEKYFKKYEKDVYKEFGKNHEGLYRIKDVVFQLSDQDYNEIGEDILKLAPEKRTFMKIFQRVVKNKPEILLDVVRAFTGI